MIAKKIKKRDAVAAAANAHFLTFITVMHPDIEVTPFHKSYYRVLHAFAMGKIKKLIIAMPPQHGKSFGATENLPAYMLGKNPNLRIAVTSYNATLAERFNKRVQKTMSSLVYRYSFPDTQIAGDKFIPGMGKVTRKGSEFEVADKKGGVIAVGRGGPLTGNRVDVVFMDDLYKDFAEGNSATVRESTWDWYTSTVRTRLHKDSQQLAVFTRWHEDDVIGRLLESEECVEINDIVDIKNVLPTQWAVLTFQAIKEAEPTQIDPREKGEALWVSRHPVDKLEADRKLDENKFQALYQQNPTPKEGLLYECGFGEYEVLPSEVGQQIKNATDTASSGDNYFGGSFYIETKTAMYVTDILFTKKNIDYTVPKMAEMLGRNGTKHTSIEANNGGKEIAKLIKNICMSSGNTGIQFSTPSQTKNKEERIRLAAPSATNLILFPKGWEKKWPEFANQLKSHRYIDAFNRYDDAADVVTYMVENFGKKRANIIMI